MKYSESFPLDLAKEALRLAEENPYFVYNNAGNCVYVDDAGCGSCLFGQAMINLGVRPEELVDKDNNSTPIVGLLHMWGHDRVPFNGVGTAQRAQDVGQPWGSEFVIEPLRKAIKELSPYSERSAA